MKKIFFPWPLVMIVLTLVNTIYASERNHDLVLHYTFDKNDGDTVIDHSGFGNNGKAHNTKYLKSEQGRKGIMRFNGTTAYVDCGDNKSTQVKGDFSFSMWVRLNGELKNGHSLIFGESAASSFWLAFAQYNTLALYYRYRSPIYGLERMAIPVDRTIIGSDWSHITVVVEYPRCRFYRNGKLVKDAWMIVPGMGKCWHSSRKYLGGDPKKHGAPIDLDELRLYRRALSKDEVAALAAGKELPARNEVELATEPKWYKNELTFRINSKGIGSGKCLVEYNVKAIGLDKRYRKTIKMSEPAGTGTKRAVASLTLPLNELSGKAGEVMAKILSPDNKVLAVVRRQFLIKKPAWVHTKEGYTDTVPAPWTPVKVTKTGDGFNVAVWGRIYTFGKTPFLVQVKSAGADLLEAPVKLVTTLDGKSSNWQYVSARLVSSDSKSCVIKQTFKNRALKLEITATIEYDGYIIFDTNLQADRKCEIDKLILDIPVKSEYAKFCYGDRVYPMPMKPKIPMGMYYSGAIKKDLAFRFSPNVWVADDKRSLCWQAESDQFWNYGNIDKAIEILPRGKTTTIQANFIDRKTVMKPREKRNIRFALLATPTRPWKKSAMDFHLIRSEPWGEDLNLPDRKVEGKAALQYIADHGVKQLFYRTACIWPYPMPLGNEWFSQQLKRMVEAAHQKGIKVHPYLFHQRYPVIVPEFEFNGLQMVKRPIRVMKEGGKPRYTPRPGSLSIENGVVSQAAVFITYQSMAVQDSYLHSLAERLDKYGEDGIFLDGTAHLPPGANLEAGAGYLDEKGKLHETYPTFAVRKFMQRLYNVIKSRKPDAVIDVHCSFSNNPSGQAYADILWTGEHWWHLRGKGTNYVAGEFPLDMARTEFSGRQQGVPVQMIGYRLGSKMKVSATSLLLDTPVRANNRGLDQILAARKGGNKEKNHTLTMFKVWALRDKFDVKNAKIHFYYENGDYVKVSPADCYSTIFVHPEHRVLAFVTNRSKETQNVTVKFNLDKLKMQGKKLKVEDALNNKPLKITSDGSVTLPLGSEEWTYLTVQEDK